MSAHLNDAHHSAGFAMKFTFATGGAEAIYLLSNDASPNDVRDHLNARSEQLKALLDIPDDVMGGLPEQTRSALMAAAVTLADEVRELTESVIIDKLALGADG